MCTYVCVSVCSCVCMTLRCITSCCGYCAGLNLSCTCMQLQTAEVCTFRCSLRVSGLVCNSIGDTGRSGRVTPKSWYEDNREHLQQQVIETSERTSSKFLPWPLSRAKRLHLLRPARFKVPVSHTATRSGAPRLFQSHSQPASGVFAGSLHQSSQQHSVMHSDNDIDSDSSSVTHSEEETQLRSNFAEMEKGTVTQCGRLHRAAKSSIKDLSLFASVFLNCVFLTIILFLLAYHNHLPLYTVSWYS